MKMDEVRPMAMALPEVTEEPHHHFGSFRVRGKIFATFPPGDAFLHLFLSEADREQTLVLHAAFAEKLLWGGKVVGVRIALAAAEASAVEILLHQAWRNKAPKSLVKS